MQQQQRAFENIVGKGEIAHNKQFLLFQQCFLFNQLIVSPFVHIFNIISLFAAEFEKPKIGITGKWFKEKRERVLRHSYYTYFEFTCHSHFHLSVLEVSVARLRVYQNSCRQFFLNPFQSSHCMAQTRARFHCKRGATQ